MRKARIINVLILLFIIISSFLLCGCSIVGEDGKIEFYIRNPKKQEKILNDIIDNLDNVTVMKEYYNLECEFDKSMNGIFYEEYNIYNEYYSSLTFHGEYKENIYDEDAQAEIEDYTEYCYLTTDELVVMRFKDGKCESHDIIRNLADYVDFEQDALPDTMNKDDDSWKQGVKLQKAARGEVHFKFKETIETKYEIRGKAYDCKIEGDYCLYINNSRITKIVSHLVVYFTSNPINSTPYGEYTPCIEINGETIFEYEKNKSYDDILALFDEARVNRVFINCEGYVNGNPSKIGTVCKVEHIEGNTYKVTASISHAENNFTFSDGFYVIADLYMDINSSMHRDFQERIKYQNASIELADSAYFENGAYCTNNDYLKIKFEFLMVIDQANYIDYRDIKIKIS